MADTNHNAPVLFPDRSVTIRESYRYINADLDQSTYPSMRLRGKWLEEAGFAPPQRVRIEVTLGRLVITPIPEEDCDHLGRDGFPILDRQTGLRRRMRCLAKDKNKPNAFTA
ncbi:SymE family type I addiction module toxin [Burkholderia plantarii]|uniref:SymE family type I addiction module toxin n=1 Tax=Burkholderia plantarii TaxID=41899 RepID=UPI0018DDA07D|nr:SymE family type I addiction module toxin [Burkholderia plantarii]MBI0329201.1 type I toxin-antitoxin system SymE family toxin [Burkholderia plantarii]